MGYAPHLVMILSPNSGSDVVIDFEVAFPDFVNLGGAQESGLRHEVEMDDRLDVNRSGAPVVYGARLAAQIKIPVTSASMSEQATIAQILNFLMAPGDGTAYLSGDNNATREAVVLAGYEGPVPIAGKTFAGGLYTLKLKGRDQRDTIPNLGTSWPS